MKLLILLFWCTLCTQAAEWNFYYLAGIDTVEIRLTDKKGNPAPNGLVITTHTSWICEPGGAVHSITEITPLGKSGTVTILGKRMVNKILLGEHSDLVFVGTNSSPITQSLGIVQWGAGGIFRKSRKTSFVILK